MAGALVSCKDYEEADSATFLEGQSKTPIAVQTNLSTAQRSRAFDKTFEKNDQLFAYIEAGKMVNGVFDATASTFKWADNFSLTRQVTTSKEEGKGNITSTTEDSDLSPIIYWDDFSSTAYDLREDGRGIRLKYGYCYNGGKANASNNTSDAAKEAGTLTWTVLSDLSAAEAMKKSDLLYAKTQEMITYGHDPESRGTLILPYTHAMSKITINVTTGEGYDASKENFASSVLTLKNMQVKADVDAPNATVEAVSTAGIDDITTFNKAKAETTATYQAIVAPTNLTAGNILATIANIDGNNYDIPLTDGILDAWKAEDKLIASNEVIYNGIAQAKPNKPLSRANIYAGTGYLTKPGIHYILDVTVDKQKITIRATITDWESVKADGKGEIKFNADVKTIDKDNSITSGSFDIFHATTTDALAKTTTATYTEGKWVNTPNIYWENGSTNYYFRGLASYDGSKPSTVNGSLNATQGTDLLWATTAAHNGTEADGTSHNYAEGAAINPRTGDIPMQFYHAMSKLTVNLTTAAEGDAAAVDLEGAKISISNLSTTGTIAIADGTIAKGDNVENAIDKMQANISNYPVIPQELNTFSIITITLADGTTYKLNLRDCIDADNNNVIEWTRGKHYTYTIYLEKEKITFRALVKDWVDATGSGSATLEWD